ncbi:MAG: hypothetical protein P4L43_16655 [Syntrophobacteraceae bacterium]|nr:hypothetical protein [Syntrophobacteraceae bacterium]
MLKMAMGQEARYPNPLVELASELAKYVCDPYGWVLYAFPWGEPGSELASYSGPDKWQEDILKDIGRRLSQVSRDGARDGAIIREATASGHGVGKSTLVAWLILWAVSTFENTRGVVTANTDKQLRTKTWPELTKWFRLCWFAGGMSGAGCGLFEATSAAIYSSDPRHQKTWRIDQVPWNERNTEAFAGLHNKGKRILLVFDEASAIPDVIWEVSEGALTDEGTEIMWCVFGNPTRNSGRFKDCFTGPHAGRWNSRQIDSRTCSLTNKEQIDQWADDYGEDSDFFKVRVRGVFPSRSAKQFISVADVDAAFGRHLRSDQYDFASKILSVDPAWEGDDELVIGLRQGLAFSILRVVPKNDNDMEIANIIARLEDEEKADAVFIDAGYGTGIVSGGRTLGRNWQLVWFAGASLDSGCANKRAEMWKLMRDWLKAGGAIPKDSTLYNDLIGPETVARVDGKIQMEPKDAMKKRGLRSPNRADCLAISFAYPVSSSRSRPPRPAFALTEYDPLERE